MTALKKIMNFWRHVIWINEILLAKSDSLRSEHFFAINGECKKPVVRSVAWPVPFYGRQPCVLKMSQQFKRIPVLCNSIRQLGERGNTE